MIIVINEFGLGRFTVYSGFGLDSFHCTFEYYLECDHFYSYKHLLKVNTIQNVALRYFEKLYDFYREIV